MRLSELQEDILKMAEEQPEMTDEAIANVLGCNENWVAKTRDKHESDVSAADLPRDYQTVDDPFGGRSSSSSGGFSLLGLLVFGPVKLALWAVEVSIRISLWAVALPFRMLGALFGSKSD